MNNLLIWNITKTIDRELAKPYMNCVTQDSRGNIKIVVASDKFEDKDLTERLDMVGIPLFESIRFFGEQQVSYFLMSEKEYRHACKSPTFIGI